MDSRSTKRVKKTATGVALVAGLVVALSAGTAQAGGPHPGADANAGRDSDRVLLKSNKVGSAAATATLTLSPSAPRIVGGAGARVTAQYSCPTGFDGYLEVQLDEVTTGHVSHAYGYNSKALTCNGVKHSMNISVVVYNDYPLAAGKAFGRATLDAFTETDEATAATEGTINIT